MVWEEGLIFFFKVINLLRKIKGYSEKLIYFWYFLFVEKI